MHAHMTHIKKMPTLLCKHKQLEKYSKHAHIKTYQYTQEDGDEIGLTICL